MANEDGTLLHGALDPYLKLPVLVELDGRSLRVVERTPQPDLHLASWRRGIYRTYLELELSDGTTLVVFHDLVSGGWFRQVVTDPAPDAL